MVFEHLRDDLAELRDVAGPNDSTEQSSPAIARRVAAQSARASTRPSAGTRRAKSANAVSTAASEPK